MNTRTLTLAQLCLELGLRQMLSFMEKYGNRKIRVSQLLLDKF